MAETESSTPTSPTAGHKFQIFRACDARPLMELGMMSVEFPPEVRPMVDEAVASGLLHGDEVKVLINLPGFSLVHAWLKKDYPLALHTHDSDCLYCIISGALRLGNQILCKGDGFFVPAEVPYSYVPVGENGVEVLEFRHATSFNFLNLAKGEQWWSKALETVSANHEAWANATRPSELATTGN